MTKAAQKSTAARVVPLRTGWSLDSLKNLLTGLGVAGVDKTVANQFVWTPLTKTDVENMYRGDWIGRKLIDLPAYDMVRERREWKGDADQIDVLESVEKRLKFWMQVRKALCWQRLYGGAAIVIDDGGNPSTELKAERVRQGALRALHVVSKHRWTMPDGLDSDIRSPTFGMPKTWMLQIGTTLNVQVHPSRVVVFHGKPAPDTDLLDDFWGDSIFESCYQAVMNAASSSQNLASLLADAVVDMVGIENLPDQLSTEDSKNRLLARWEFFRLGKSQFKVALSNKDKEVFTRTQTQFANLDAVTMMFLIIVSGAADIPATRMLGQAPTGINATGEFDLRNYYNSVEAQQETDLRPNLEYLDQFIMQDAFGGPIDGLWFDFRPLWTPTAKEQADTAKIVIDMANTLVANAAVNQGAVMRGIEGYLVETGILPGFEQGLKEFESLEPDPEAALASLLDPAEGADPSVNSQGEDPSSSGSAGTTEGDPSAGAQSKEGDPKSKKANEDRHVLRRDRVSDATPVSLYVSRPVLNAKQILQWAAAQGFKSLETADELHVTICFSRVPIDWMQIPQSYTPKLLIEGGPRIVQVLGDEGAVVVLFRSDELLWRHAQFKEFGASWDYAEYQPHVTISYDAAGVDLSKVEPYQGPILLGPERFERLDENAGQPKGAHYA